MAFVPFHDYFPELAEREVRTITVLPDSDIALPPDEYSFLEMYCNERRCDCRRVLFYVVARSRKNVQAVIGWGWEDMDYYAKWMLSGDKAMARLMKGPALNPGSPGSELGPALVTLVGDVLLKDADYIKRIKRHYRMVREVIDKPRWQQRLKPRKRR